MRFGALLLVVSALAITGCSQDKELAGDDPENCEILKEDFPEQYEECLEKMG